MESFVNLHQLRAIAVTWNVNGRFDTSSYGLRRQLLGMPCRSLEKDTITTSRPSQVEVTTTTSTATANAIPMTSLANPLLCSSAAVLEATMPQPTQSTTSSSSSSSSTSSSSSSTGGGGGNDNSNSNSGISENDVYPDLVIVGLQEMVELSTSNVLGGQKSLEQLSIWQQILDKALNDYCDEDQEEYVLLDKHNMVGLGLLVFIKRSLRSQVRHAQHSFLPRGVGGVLGNKGAVYSRWQIYDSTVCVINAHFTAHREHVEKRNADYEAILNHPAFLTEMALQEKKISEELPPLIDTTSLYLLKNDLKQVKKKMAHALAAVQDAATAPMASAVSVEGMAAISGGVPLGSGSASMASMPPLASTGTVPTAVPTSSSTSFFLSHDSTTSSSLRATDHDLVIWLGDLNYRLDKSVPLHIAYYLIEKEDIPLLAALDQLTIEKEALRVFHDFHEGMLTFPPTYQFIPGKNVYNTVSKKQRIPAWCDRILWRTSSKPRPRRNSIVRHHPLPPLPAVLPDHAVSLLSDVSTAEVVVAPLQTQSYSQADPEELRSSVDELEVTAIDVPQTTSKDVVGEGHGVLVLNEDPVSVSEKAESGKEDEEGKSVVVVESMPSVEDISHLEEQEVVVQQQHLSENDELPREVETETNEVVDHDDNHSSRESNSSCTSNSSSEEKEERDVTKDSSIASQEDPHVESKLPDKPPRSLVSSRAVRNLTADSDSDDSDGLVETVRNVTGVMDSDDEDSLISHDDLSDDGDEEMMRGVNNRIDNEGAKHEKDWVEQEVEEVQRTSLYLKRQSLLLLQRSLRSEEWNHLLSTTRNSKTEAGTKTGEVLTGTVATTTTTTSGSTTEDQSIHVSFPDFPNHAESSHSILAGSVSPQAESAEAEDTPVIADLFPSIPPPSATVTTQPKRAGSFTVPVEIARTVATSYHPLLPTPSRTPIPSIARPIMVSGSHDDEEEDDDEQLLHDSLLPASYLRPILRQKRKREECGYVDEKVELMEYNSIPSLCLSDHKPVRALLNITVKAVNWAAREEQKIKETLPLLTDPLVTLSLGSSSKKGEDEAKTDLCGLYRKSLAHLSYFSYQPKVITLRSLSNAGDHQVIHVTNLHRQYKLRFSVCDSACSTWLDVQPAQGVLRSGEKTQIVVTNRHTESTLRLVEDVEHFRPYGSDQLPALAKHIRLTLNDPQLRIYAMLAIRIDFLEDDLRHSSRSGVVSVNETVKKSMEEPEGGGGGIVADGHHHDGGGPSDEIEVAEDVFIPVVCALSI
eukprot:gene3152-3452_t